VVTLYLAWGDAAWLTHQHSTISVLTTDDPAGLLGRACLHCGVHVLGVALLWQTYFYYIGVESSGKFLGAHRVFISTGMNPIIPHQDVPITVYDDVLDTDQRRLFLAELGQSQLELHQPYPNRIFTRPEHTDWLRSYFNLLIHNAVTDLGLSGEVQQVFMSFEMPGCEFMYHRAHVNIGAVICYSIDDFPGIELAVLTEGFDDADEYLWGDKGRAGHKLGFVGNQALVIHNRDPRHHWGFTALIGECRVKRNVWIYLGK
jgi:hypothetical protein